MSSAVRLVGGRLANVQRFLYILNTVTRYIGCFFIVIPNISLDVLLLISSSFFFHVPDKVTP